MIGVIMEFLNSLEELIGINDRPVEEFEVPEWGRKVYLRGMTGTDRDAFEAHVSNGGREGSMNLIGMRAKMVAACLVNAEGERIASPRDEAVLGNTSAKALDRLFTKCMELNGMSQEDEEKLKESFGDGQSDGSTSA